MRNDGLVQELGALYSTCRQELFTYALSIVGNQSGAEDIVHEAFRKMLALGHRPAELRPYAFRCLRNAALDQLRFLKREAEKVADYRLLFDQQEQPDLSDEIAEMLASLSDSEREIIVLKIFSGLTFREVAEVCELPQGTVAASYWRSLKKLRDSRVGVSRQPLTAKENEA